jgi:hypothetical protein
MSPVASLSEEGRTECTLLICLHSEIEDFKVRRVQQYKKNLVSIFVVVVLSESKSLKLSDCKCIVKQVHAQQS